MAEMTIHETGWIDRQDSAFPQVAAFPDGELVCSFCVDGGPNVHGGSALARSLDAGRSWQPVGTILPPTQEPFTTNHLKVTLAPDGETLLAYGARMYRTIGETFGEGRNEAIVLRSTDRGQSWSEPLVLPNPDDCPQKVYLVEQADKHALLAQLLKGDDAKQVIVFTKTKLTASRLARQLQREGVAADAIHGDKSQLERQQALESFKQGSVSVLIATDVAARGLDIDHLPMVINYEIPHAAEDYVHRIGRTGRAGASGKALSLVSPEEEKYLVEIEKLIKTGIEKETAVVPHAARSSRPPAAAHEPHHAYHKPAANKPAHDPWFDQPYVPKVTEPAPPTAKAEFALDKPKAPVPALFRRSN